MALLACAPGTEVSETSRAAVVAIDGDEVAYAEFEAFLQSAVGEEQAGLSDAVLSALFDKFLDERLLVRLASQRGLVSANAKPREALEALLAEQSLEPSEEEIAEYYRNRVAHYQLPERVELLQILVDTKEQAVAARERILRGEAFEEVAREVSVDPSAPFGGYQGELAREDLPVALADEIFALEPRQVSELLEREYGYHLFFVASRLEPETVPLAQAREEILRELRSLRAEESLVALTAEARERFPVELEPRFLPFEYKNAED